MNIPLRPFLDQQGFVVLDGGLATELEARGPASLPARAVVAPVLTSAAVRRVLASVAIYAPFPSVAAAYRVHKMERLGELATFLKPINAQGVRKPIYIDSPHDYVWE